MKTIHYQFDIPAPAEEVYRAITNPFTIELWSGFSAEMKLEKESEFSLFDGDISGKVIDFEENKLLKQEWFFGDQEEKSVVTMTLKGKGEKTHVDLLHENIPEEAFEDMKVGWKKYYWGAILKFFK